MGIDGQRKRIFMLLEVTSYAVRVLPRREDHAEHEAPWDLGQLAELRAERRRFGAAIAGPERGDHDGARVWQARDVGASSRSDDVLEVEDPMTPDARRVSDVEGDPERSRDRGQAEE
jgi:hypothetical protein